MANCVVLILAVFVCLVVKTAEGRQKCLSCQYQPPLKSGIPCTEAPWNWTGGNVRMRCPHKCVFNVWRDIEKDEVTYAYRGCTTYNDKTKDGCRDQDGVQYCYYTCTDVYYCNNWTATQVFAWSRSPTAWSSGAIVYLLPLVLLAGWVVL